MKTNVSSCTTGSVCLTVYLLLLLLLFETRNIKVELDKSGRTNVLQCVLDFKNRPMLFKSQIVLKIWRKKLKLEVAANKSNNLYNNINWWTQWNRTPLKNNKFYNRKLWRVLLEWLIGSRNVINSMIQNWYKIFWVDSDRYL